MNSNKPRDIETYRQSDEECTKLHVSGAKTINQICKEQEIKYVSVEALGDSHCYCVFVAVSPSVFTLFFPGGRHQKI